MNGQVERELWTPPDAGVVPDDVRQAQLAVKTYDEQLSLGVDKVDNTWCVLWDKGPGGAPYPVLGLGRELPGYEEIQKRLYMADTVRRGSKIVAEVTARRDKAAKAAKDAHTELAGDVAEHLESAFHRADKTSYKRVYQPGIALPGKDF